MSKKILSILLALVMVIAIAPVSVFAQDDVLSYLTYEIVYEDIDYEVKITDCDESISGGIVIPDTIEGYPVTEIGSDAFRDCTNLESITIPNSVTTIGSDAFYNCTSLERITIPDSVTSIQDDSFSNCINLTNITVDQNNEYYSSDEYGVLFNKDKTELIQYPIGNSRTEYIIPDSVTLIDEYAFRCCTNLESIKVNELNEYYSFDEHGVLFNKDKTELIQYPIGNSRPEYTIPDSVELIGEDSFRNCTTLSSVIIGNNVFFIGDGAFGECTSLTDITIPGSVGEIGQEAFYGCTSLTKAIISDSVTSIGLYAFCNCTALSSVIISNNVFFIGGWAFSGCTSLTDITIPESVGEIGPEAFYGCTSLTSITIPDSVYLIYSHAFDGCTNLKKVEIGENAGIVIYTSIFLNCSNLESITVDENSIHYSSDEYGVLFNKDKTKLIRYPECNIKTDYTVSDSVTEIGPFAFDNCSKLKSVTLGNNVTTVYFCAFGGCTELTSVTISSSVTTIVYNAFVDCKNLKSVIIPKNVTEIGDWAFGYVYNDVTGEEELIEDFIIYGYTGTAAETYANENNITFVALCEEHMSTEVKDKVDATCVADGYTGDTYCKDCGVLITKGETIPALGHTEEVLTGKAATCTESGLTEGKKCSICNEILTEQEKIEATGHVAEPPMIIIPGCVDEEFILTDICIYCGEKFNERKEMVPGVGHVEQILPEVPATYTSTGLTEGKKCSVCDEILVVQEVIPMLEMPNLTPNTENITVTDTVAASAPEMSVETFIASIENENVQILDKDGKELANDAFVGTGSKINILDKDGKILSTYEVMVKADVDGNGKITTADARLTLRASVGLDTIAGVYETAANYDGKDNVSTADARMILRKAVGLE